MADIYEFPQANVRKQDERLRSQGYRIRVIDNRLVRERDDDNDPRPAA